MSESQRLRQEVHELWTHIDRACGNTPDLRMARRCLVHCLVWRLQRLAELR